MEKKQQVQNTSCEILPKLFSKCLCDNLKWFQSPDVRIIVFCRLFTFFSFYFQKDDDVNWPVLKPDIFASIMDFFASNIPILTENQPASDTGRLSHVHQKCHLSIVMSFDLNILTPQSDQLLISPYIINTFIPLPPRSD